MSFATGYFFGYWLSWKNGTAEEISDSYKNAFDGYSKSELYVPPHFTTLKEEILQSGFVKIKSWNLHLTKAKE